MRKNAILLTILFNKVTFYLFTYRQNQTAENVYIRKNKNQKSHDTVSRKGCWLNSMTAMERWVVLTFSASTKISFVGNIYLKMNIGERKNTGKNATVTNASTGT
jgi:hypothetical protein